MGLPSGSTSSTGSNDNMNDSTAKMFYGLNEEKTCFVKVTVQGEPGEKGSAQIQVLIPALDQVFDASVDFQMISPEWWDNVTAEIREGRGFELVAPRGTPNAAPSKIKLGLLLLPLFKATGTPPSYALQLEHLRLNNECMRFCQLRAEQLIQSLSSDLKKLHATTTSLSERTTNGTTTTVIHSYRPNPQDTVYRGCAQGLWEIDDDRRLKMTVQFPSDVQFSQPPVLITSLIGSDCHLCALGGSNPYDVTTQGFVIYLHVNPRLLSSLSEDEEERVPNEQDLIPDEDPTSQADDDNEDDEESNSLDAPLTRMQRLQRLAHRHCWRINWVAIENPEYRLPRRQAIPSPIQPIVPKRNLRLVPQ